MLIHRDSQTEVGSHLPSSFFLQSILGLIQRNPTAYTDAPDIQAAFWLGGYQSSDTSPLYDDDTKSYSDKMYQLNTTTGQFTMLDPPYTAVEQGALVFLPFGDEGSLVFMGGEVPSIAKGANATLSSVSLFSSVILGLPAADTDLESMESCASLRHCPRQMVQSIHHRHRVI